MGVCESLPLPLKNKNKNNFHPQQLFHLIFSNKLNEFVDYLNDSSFNINDNNNNTEINTSLFYHFVGYVHLSYSDLLRYRIHLLSHLVESCFLSVRDGVINNEGYWHYAGYYDDSIHHEIPHHIPPPNPDDFPSPPLEVLLNQFCVPKNFTPTNWQSSPPHVNLLWRATKEHFDNVWDQYIINKSNFKLNNKYDLEGKKRNILRRKFEIFWNEKDKIQSLLEDIKFLRNNLKCIKHFPLLPKCFNQKNKQKNKNEKNLKNSKNESENENEKNVNEIECGLMDYCMFELDMPINSTLAASWFGNIHMLKILIEKGGNPNPTQIYKLKSKNNKIHKNNNNSTQNPNLLNNPHSHINDNNHQNENENPPENRSFHHTNYQQNNPSNHSPSPVYNPSSIPPPNPKLRPPSSSSSSSSSPPSHLSSSPSLNLFQQFFFRRRRNNRLNNSNNNNNSNNTLNSPIKAKTLDEEETQIELIPVVVENNSRNQNQNQNLNLNSQINNPNYQNTRNTQNNLNASSSHAIPQSSLSSPSPSSSLSPSHTNVIPPPPSNYVIDECSVGECFCSALTSVIMSNRPLGNRVGIVEILLKSPLIDPSLRVESSIYLGNFNSFEAACHKENYEIMKKLLEFNPKLINIKNPHNDNKIPLQVALKEKKEKLIKFLLENGSSIDFLFEKSKYSWIQQNYNNGSEEHKVMYNLVNSNLNHQNIQIANSLFLSRVLSSGSEQLAKHIYSVGLLDLSSFEWNFQYLNSSKLVEFLVSIGAPPPPFNLILHSFSHLKHLEFSKLFNSLELSIQNGLEIFHSSIRKTKDFIETTYGLPASIIMEYSFESLNVNSVLSSPLCNLCNNSTSTRCYSCNLNNFPHDFCEVRSGHYCSHQFHLHCIREWINKGKQTKCPNCDEKWEFKPSPLAIESFKNSPNHHFNNFSNFVSTNEIKIEKDGKDQQDDHYNSQQQQIQLINSPSENIENYPKILIGGISVPIFPSFKLPDKPILDDKTADEIVAALELEEKLEEEQMKQKQQEKQKGKDKVSESHILNNNGNHYDNDNIFIPENQLISKSSRLHVDPVNNDFHTISSNDFCVHSTNSPNSPSSSPSPLPVEIEIDLDLYSSDLDPEWRGKFENVEIV